MCWVSQVVASLVLFVSLSFAPCWAWAASNCLVFQGFIQCMDMGNVQNFFGLLCCRVSLSGREVLVVLDCGWNMCAKVLSHLVGFSCICICVSFTTSLSMLPSRARFDDERRRCFRLCGSLFAVRNRWVMSQSEFGFVTGELFRQLLPNLRIPWREQNRHLASFLQSRVFSW